MKKTNLINSALIFILFSCQQFISYNDFPKNQEVVVYSAGFYNPGSPRACYWENTMLHNVQDNSNSSVIFSIFVYNNDVYTAGSNNLRACYWKNDSEIHYLCDVSPLSTRACSVYVRSGIVFIAGYGTDGMACFWIIDGSGNAVRKTINNANTAAGVATSIFVDENFNIYLAGYGYNYFPTNSGPFDTTGSITFTKGFYWSTNYGYKSLSDNTVVHSMVVKNGIAYLGGFTNISYAPIEGFLCYWKEDNLIYQLSFSSPPISSLSNLSIYLSNQGDIYLSDYDLGYIIKNKSILNTGIFNACTVYVFQDNLYAGGDNNLTYSCYYIGENNSNNLIRPTDPYNNSRIFSMFVKFGN